MLFIGTQQLDYFIKFFCTAKVIEKLGTTQTISKTSQTDSQTPDELKESKESAPATYPDVGATTGELPLEN